VRLGVDGEANGWEKKGGWYGGCTTEGGCECAAEEILRGAVHDGSDVAGRRMDGSGMVD
jgi:hypothetical protein